MPCESGMRVRGVRVKGVGNGVARASYEATAPVRAVAHATHEMSYDGEKPRDAREWTPHKTEGEARTGNVHRCSSAIARHTHDVNLLPLRHSAPNNLPVTR